MRVYFAHIDKSRLHSLYGELINYPPVNYVNLYKLKLRKIERKRKTSFVFRMGKVFINLFNLPSMYKLNGNCDLVHASQHIPICKSPWVVDIEHVSAFAGFNINRLNSKICKYLIRKFLESSNCRKIMPWTNAAKISLLNYINSQKIKNKIEVIYPAISLPKIKKKKQDKIKFLYVAYDFYRKGGYEALKAFEKIKEKYENIKMEFVCKIPDIRNKCKDVKFMGLLPREILLSKIFPNADIFLYPTFHDTFGMVLLEALSFGLPVITLEDFATPEIVDNSKDGFIIKGYKTRWYNKNYQHIREFTDWRNLIKYHSKKEQDRIINEIANKMKLLIEDSKLRKYMSKNARRKIELGRFSIKERNKRLRRVYEKSIKISR